MLSDRRLRWILHLALVTLLLLKTLSASTQSCTPIYHKTYNGKGSDEAYDIKVTSDGGSIVAGRTTSNALIWDGLLMRLNTQGDIVWSKSYGGNDYDELTKVKQTSDGGFIALGNTKSFGLQAGAAWLMRVDANGDLLWSRQLHNNGEPARARSIVQLKDGGFAAAFNTNDSTAAGNGVIVRTDPSGIPMWTKVFDNGKDDGFNHLHEDGNTLLAAGYASINDREGLLMRIDVSNGAVRWAKTFSRTAGLSDEIIHVETTAKGLAFGASATLIKTVNGWNPYSLTLFKTVGDDSVHFERRAEVYTRSTTRIQNVTLRTTADGGFIFAATDTTPLGWASFHKISAAGLSDWGRGQTGATENRVYGLDLFADQGYLVAGHMRAGTDPANTTRIQVLKTDILGKTGECTGNPSTHFIDSTIYPIRPFSWSSITEDVEQMSIAPLITPLVLATSTLCADTYCDEPDKPANDSCAATLLAHLKSSYTFLPYDMVKLNDGYLIFGFNRLYINSEPMMVKMRSDGSVAWSKTLASYMHNQGFDQVIKASDGNFFVSGKDNVIIDHYSFLGDIIMKINPAGEVLWSKYINGDIYDMKPDNQGGLIGTTTRNYGSPPIYNSFFKMDANGNVTWQKELNSNNHPIYRKILQEGGFIYAAGEFYNQHPQHIGLEKFDLTGNRLWSKRFTINGFYTSVESMDIIGDSIYLLANFLDNSEISYISKRKLAAVKFDKDGEGMNGFNLEHLHFADDPYHSGFFSAVQQRTTKTSDDHFVVADRADATSDSSIVLTKFSGTGKIIWSVRYDNLNSHYVSKVKDDAGSLLVLGRKYNGIIDFVNAHDALFMRTDNLGQVTTNGTAFCHTIPHAVTTKPVEFKFNTYIPPMQATEGRLSTSAYDIDASRAFVIKSSISCKLNSNCAQITVKGPNAICNTADTFTYYFTRNEGCTTPGVWKYDTVNINTIQQTDTSISVQFRTPGIFRITASLLFGCSAIIDSLEVTVPLTANSLTLGGDTVICDGTTILLNAKKGFTTYRWQDHSTDSTLVVRMPGIYQVTVTDVCNQQYTSAVTISKHPPIPVDIGVDRSICINDTVQLHAPGGFIDYSWDPAYNISSSSAQSVVVRPTADTVYILRAEKSPGCFAYDTVAVTVYRAPAIQLGADLSFCSGDSATFDGGSGFHSYQWSSGENSRRITTYAPGRYILTGITDKGCRSTDTALVTSVWPSPVVRLDTNPELCKGSTRTLQAGSFSSYRWHDGSTAPGFVANGIGKYYVQVTDVHGCVGTDTTEIKSILPLPDNFLPSDTAICSYGETEIKPRQAYSSYSWSDGNRSSMIKVQKPGLYWLQVLDKNNCIGRDSMVVSLKDCMIGVYIPTGFTPNGDGKNDVFKAMVFGKVNKFEMTVYNRWGQVIFQTVEHSRGWDGKIASYGQVTGAFVWTCRYQLDGEKETFRKGFVTVLR